jgi:prevent-host-death family protein
MVGMRRPRRMEVILRDEMTSWKFGEAKKKLGALIEKARGEGPQTIIRHGSPRAVVLSIEDYRDLAAPTPDFRAYLLGGPKVDDFEIEREGR